MSVTSYLTNSGRLLLAKMLASERLVYTKATTSSAVVEQPEVLQALPQERQTATVLTVGQQGDCAVISASFNCAALEQSYQLSLVGIYAKIEGTADDVLYMVTVFDPEDGVVTLPAGQAISYKVTIYDTMANGSMSVTVADSAAAPAEHVPNAYRHIFTQTNSDTAEAVVDSGDFSNFSAGQKIVFVPAVTLIGNSSHLVMGGQRYPLRSVDLAGNSCSCLFIANKSYVLTFLNGDFTYVKHNEIEVKDGVSHYWNGAGWSTVIPAGEIIASAANPAPPGTVLCDGRSLSRADYAQLFAAIGTTYGSSSGTTFKVPDARGRCMIGANSAYALGSSGGAAEVALTAAQMPAHKHTGSVSISGGAHTHTVTITVTPHTHTLSNVTAKSAGNHTHSMANVTAEPAGAHTHGAGSITAKSAGSHNHTYSKYEHNSSQTYSSKLDDEHDNSGWHTVSANTGSGGAHTHETQGSTNSGGAHGHELQGSPATAGAHTHEMQGNTGSSGGGSYTAATSSTSPSLSGTISMNNAGSGQAHNNMQPYLAINYYIYTGRPLL